MKSVSTRQEFKYITNIKNKVSKDIYIKYLEEIIKIQLNYIRNLRKCINIK